MRGRVAASFRHWYRFTLFAIVALGCLACEAWSVYLALWREEWSAACWWGIAALSFRATYRRLEEQLRGMVR